MSPVVIIEFVIATILPVLAAAAFTLIDQTRNDSARSPLIWQVTVGLSFGLIAILGTELGIETPDAIMNVRDAAPLVAGLVFGPRAGIIAGVMGGVERWFAALWGRGMFTRVACSTATILAGFYAAILREKMFDGKRPKWQIATAVGVVTEVLHLMLVLLTNLDQSQRAYQVARACAVIMVPCTGISVGLAVWVVSLLERDNVKVKRKELDISEAIQRGMLYAIIFAFVLTTGFSTLLQTRLATTTTKEILRLNILDVMYDVEEASRLNLLILTNRATRAVSSVDSATHEQLVELTETLGVAEVSVIDENGIIVESSDPGIVGFDMASGEQSSEFLILLEGVGKAYVQDYQQRTYEDGKWVRYAGVVIDGGFIQVGYDTKQYRSELLTQVKLSVSNRHVGTNGYMMVLTDPDSEGEDESPFLTEPIGLDSEVERTLLDLIAANQEDHVCETILNNVSYYAMYGDIEDYHIVALLPQSEADQSRNVSILVGCFTETIVFALLFASIYFFIKDVVVDGIRSMNSSLSEITAGNLDVKVDVHTSTEFSELSEGINATVDSLKSYIAEADARIDQELAYARDIQKSALPQTFPPYPGHTDFEIFATAIPAKLVGGDFYDIYLLDDDHLCFLIADVSGKGIPAAMFMMRAKSVIKSYVSSGLPVDWAFTNANEVLCDGNDANMFVTSWMAIVDLATGHVTAVNAGHNPPALMRQSKGTFEPLNIKRNLILGCMGGIPYRMNEFDLDPGDVLFLYTDGVVEANNEDEELYGEKRMLKALDQLSTCTMRRMCEGIHQSVDKFVGSAPQFDDITMLAFLYNGREDGTWKVDSEPGEVLAVESVIMNEEVLTDYVDERLEGLGCTLRAQHQIDIAIDEVFSNICKFAYVDGTGPVWMRFRKLHGRDVVEITFEDEGVAFDPLSVDSPDISQDISERAIGGLGIMMLKKMMDDVTYQRRDGRNVLAFKKSIK